MIFPLLSAAQTIVLPLLAVFMPGVALIAWDKERHGAAWGARVVLLSVSLFVLISYFLVWARISVAYTWPALFIITGIGIFFRRRRILALGSAWYLLTMLMPVVMLYALFCYPYVRVQSGLPTGDAQKAIIWAQEILTSFKLPNYQLAVSNLNRDPVDFYTPGLHTALAALMAVAPQPLMVVGLFAILVSVLVALIAAAIAKDMFDIPNSYYFPSTLVVALILTNERFLRYLKEPGYHLQNVVGELFIFGLLMLLLSLIHRWRRQDVFLFITLFLALLITHQFSAFMAAFVLLPAALIFFISRRHVFFEAMKKHPTLFGAVVLGVLCMIVGGFYLDLQKKIPDLFTLHPHLISGVPAWADYLTLLGPWWTLLGIFGFFLFCVHVIKRHQNYREGWALIGALVMILLLSRGPYVGIDIPAVRALFYIVVPLSIVAAFGITKSFMALSNLRPLPRYVASLLLLLALVAMMASSTDKAFSGVSLQAATNSTLSPEELFLSESLRGEQGGILIDDANRRSASWLVLSGRPMYARLASNIHRVMDESSQSALRKSLYLKQLDLEKIYSLGSLPEITQLLDKNNISNVLGVSHTSAPAFFHNQALQVSSAADDFVLFEKKLTFIYEQDSALPIDWLLSPAVLANDIGDDEDTFKHLPASILASRLSDPIIKDGLTYRTTTSSRIPLLFNVGDYVRPLLTTRDIHHPDTPVHVLIQLSSPVPGLILQTDTGVTRPLPGATSIVQFEASDMVIDDNGFITLYLINNQQQSVPISLIALGP